MKKLVAVIDKISTWIGKATSYLMPPAVLIVIIEIAMRHFLHRPTLWATESILFACGFLYILGGAWTLLESRHVKIDFIWEKFSLRGRAILDCITFIFFALYMLIMIWLASRFAWQSIGILEGSGTPWNPPVYPIKIAFVIALVLLFFQGMSKLIKDLYFVLHKKEL